MNLNDQYTGAWCVLGAVQPVRVPAVPGWGAGDAGSRRSPPAL